MQSSKSNPLSPMSEAPEPKARVTMAMIQSDKESAPVAAQAISKGFSPEWVEMVFTDFGKLAASVLQSALDLQSSGLTVDAVTQIFNACGPLAVKLLNDLTTLRGNLLFAQQADRDAELIVAFGPDRAEALGGNVVNLLLPYLVKILEPIIREKLNDPAFTDNIVKWFISLFTGGTAAPAGDSVRVISAHLDEIGKLKAGAAQMRDEYDSSWKEIDGENKKLREESKEKDAKIAELEAKLAAASTPPAEKEEEEPADADEPEHHDKPKRGKRGH